MTKERATVPQRVVAGPKRFFITLGGPQAHDSSDRDLRFLSLTSFPLPSTPDLITTAQIFVTHGDVPSVFGAHARDPHIRIDIDHSGHRAVGQPYPEPLTTAPFTSRGYSIFGVKSIHRRSLMARGGGLGRLRAPARQAPRCALSCNRGAPLRFACSTGRGTICNSSEAPLGICNCSE